MATTSRLGNWRMDYFDELRKGSQFHKVHILSDRAFRIEPIDDRRESLRTFQEVADEASENETSDYEVKPHAQYRIDLPGWSGPIFDFVLITKVT
jgi:hypothetical protein